MSLEEEKRTCLVNFLSAASAGARNDQALRAAFERFGEITEAKVIADRETGRSRGFGFVTFTTADAATKAVEAMNGTELDGRTLNVDVAQDKRGGGRERRDRW